MLSSPIEEIKRRLDIIEVIQGYTKLQKAGVNYRALCPFHTEKKPSFFVSPVRQVWRCFGCQKGGDVFSFIKEIEGIEFGDALRLLADRAGVELTREDPRLKTERQRLYDICEFACRFFEKQLQESSAGKEARNYLISRGFSEESMKSWRLGYAPDAWQALSDFLVGRGYKREEIERAGLSLKSDKTSRSYDRFRARIIFPVFNLGKKPIGFGGRIFRDTEEGGAAKYINTPATMLYDKGQILYGLHRAGPAIKMKDACILVEGYTDVILASQAGFDNIVASAGTALTYGQLKILRRYSENLLTAFDMDIAGDSATKRGIDLAQSLGFNIKIITMPEGADPADIIARAPGEWQNLIDRAKSIHDFYFETTLAQFDPSTLEGKKSISKSILPVIKRIPNSIERTVWIKTLSEQLQVKEDDVLQELVKTKVDFPGQQAEEPSALSPKSRKELIEERIVLLASSEPSYLEEIGEQDYEFFSPKIAGVISYFKNRAGSDNIIPKEIQEFVDYLHLTKEAEPFLGFLDQDSAPEGKIPVGEPGLEKSIFAEKEFQVCLRELKTLVIKDKLEVLSKEIKNAEANNDFSKVQELIRDFSAKSQALNNYY